MRLILTVINDDDNSTLNHSEILERLDNRKFELKIDGKYKLPHVMGLASNEMDQGYWHLESFGQLTDYYAT